MLVIALCIGLASCKPSAYYSTPNDLSYLPGTLYLTNGHSYKGKLIISDNAHSHSAVKVYEEGDARPMRFSLDEVKGYEFRYDYYELKEIRNGLNIGKDYSFLRRLTKGGSKIHLYEGTEKQTRSGSYNRTYAVFEKKYYLQLPNDEPGVVYPLTSSRFVPNFDEKMSKVVSDCPSLATKISTKEQGYFYAQVSLSEEKRLNVLLHIIDEYNECK